ncbi:MAG: Protein of unknown function (DUF565) [Phormidesmis priestleyi Ana]|uniref:DUF565 domain-containing protein n=1 Tax=Phormidesmis priestleyi Ana TaxID=1666911 RepID=A0A0P7YT25_9CYAN|nr:MAG: Protein of unknown function (DUF565) [Phormidesmis priestleyi Ana]
MQRTRLNTLFDQIILRFRQWVFNPWRRLSVIVISLLFGNFFATAVSATAGQTAKLDVTISASLVLFVELISWLYYRFAPRQPREQGTQIVNITTGQGAIRGPVRPVDAEIGPVRSRSTLAESLNAFKLGLTYGLFVEAFKLGS